MTVRTRWTIAALALASAAAAAADDVQTTPLPRGPADELVAHVDDPGLRELLAEILGRNPEISALAARARSAGYRERSAGKLPDPMVDLTAYLLPPETRVGPQRAAARVVQQIPGGGRLGTSSTAAAFEQRAADADLQALRLRLVTEARRIAIELVYLTQADRILERDLATLGRYEELARARYASGVGLQMDAIQIQAEMTRLETQRSELGERRASLGAELNRLRDRPGAPIQELPEIQVRRGEPDWQELRDIALAQRPELVASRARVDRSATLTELAASSRAPNFSVGLNYVWVDERSDMDVPDNGRDVLGISGGITIPLWSTANRAEVEAATELRIADEARARAAVSVVESELAALRGRTAEIERRLALLEDVLPIQAAGALESAEAAYAAGRVDALALLDAERVLLDVRLSAVRARADLAIASVELEGAIAAPLPEGVSS